MVYLQQVLWIKELFFIKNKLHNYTFCYKYLKTSKILRVDTPVKLRFYSPRLESYSPHYLHQTP